jgi:hypothetical protein
VVVAALAADELELAGVATFHPAVHDAARPAPQARCPAVPGLTSKGQCHDSLGLKAQPRVTGTGSWLFTGIPP